MSEREPSTATEPGAAALADEAHEQPDEAALQAALEDELGPPEEHPQAAGAVQAAGPSGEAQGGQEAAEEEADAQAPEAGEAPAGGEVSPAELEREVAALLFASPEPVSTGRLSTLLGGTPRRAVEAALEALGRRLEQAGLPFELRPIAGGWQLFTTADMAETVAGLSRARRDEKVSPAALETLAVVAYRQPVTKAEVEAIRGVQVGPILRALVDRGLVRVCGRSPDPGHPLLYGTTRQFLDVFGLGSLDDLPRDGELLRD